MMNETVREGSVLVLILICLCFTPCRGGQDGDPKPPMRPLTVCLFVRCMALPQGGALFLEGCRAVA